MNCQLKQNKCQHILLQASNLHAKEPIQTWGFGCHWKLRPSVQKTGLGRKHHIDFSQEILL